jgi:hypothetical protein
LRHPLSSFPGFNRPYRSCAETTRVPGFRSLSSGAQFQIYARQR